jgi:hypothetical protein
LWVAFARGDLGCGYRDFLLKLDRCLEQILHKHVRRRRFVARPELGKGVDYLIVSPEDMVELEVIKFLLQLPNLLPVCSHSGAMTVQHSHDLIDNKLRVPTDVKPLNCKFSSNV